MMTDQTHIAAMAEDLLRKSEQTLDPEELNVLRSIHQRFPVSRDAADAADAMSDFGQRLSDRVAAVGGSWSFIISFGCILLGWMLLNSDVLTHFNLTFDPYPYIFLNLMLSTVAAIQAPVIMMSQNRQAAKDRIAASLDFEVNLRAELEIMRLHKKVDEAIIARLDQIIARLDPGAAPSPGGAGVSLQPAPG
jgi:uncharacterized membrane protein